MKKTSLIILIALMLTGTAHAYSGGFSALPALPGGPNSNTVNNFDVDTRNGNNPQTINTNLDYVYQVVIQTSTPEKSNMLISESPSSGQLNPSAFSFSVPQKLQDALVSATIYFWGPDVPTMSVTHVHQGIPTDVLVASRADPPLTDSSGRVLWVITTNSFSDFIPSGQDAPEKNNLPFIIYASLVMLASTSAVVLFRTG